MRWKERERTKGGGIDRERERGIDYDGYSAERSEEIQAGTKERVRKRERMRELEKEREKERKIKFAYYISLLHGGSL